MLLQVSPPSRLTVAPPSLPSIIRIGSAGSNHRSWSSWWGEEITSKVCPPSVERYTFLQSDQTCSGSVGWAYTWVK